MENQKNNKGVIGVLIAIIVLLLCAVCYLLFGKELLNNKSDNSTTTITTTTKTTENEDNNNNDFTESNYVRKTSLILVDEADCSNNSSLKAEINSNKNITLTQDKATDEIIVGNAKYLYKVNILTCDDVILYYITEDNGLYVVYSPYIGDPNRKVTKISSSKIIEFLGEDDRDDGYYLKVLTSDKKVEYINYFTAPDFKSE